MHIKDNACHTYNRKVGLMAFLLAIVGALALLPTTTASPASTAGRLIIVSASGQPSQDVAAINEAIAQAQSGDAIRLIGHFDLGDDCENCVVIDKAVTIEGSGDPTGPAPVESLVTIVEGGTGPFLVALDSDTIEAAQQGRRPLVRIANIWFRNMTLMAISLAKTQGSGEIERNRITDITPGPSAMTCHLICSALVSRPPSRTPEDLSGSIALTGNYIDLFNGPAFRFGDDNAFAAARCNFSEVRVVENFFETRGEAEFEGCSNPDARVTYARNEIIMHANVSPVGLLVPKGGHPAAIKIHDNDASRVEVRDNDITTLGNHRACACL